MVGTDGSPFYDQPNGDVFAVIAINPVAFNLVQTGISGYGIEDEELSTGVGQRVRAVSLLIHELAENPDFSINGTGGGNPKPDRKLLKKKLRELCTINFIIYLSVQLIMKGRINMQYAEKYRSGGICLLSKVGLLEAN